MAADKPAIEISHVMFRYGQRVALDDISLAVHQGEILVWLGKNGSGKSTLFRLLTTLVPLQQGTVTILGRDLRREVQIIRQRIGVVFQSPSVDLKLTVFENLSQQAALYGLSRSDFRSRADELLRQLGLSDRRHERAQTLSGGLRRRVELAKGMLHLPQILLMDEPSTGLDPGARNDVWQHLKRLQTHFGVTVVMTTHLLEEAEKADRLAILDNGRLVALDRPEALRGRVSGDVVNIETQHPRDLADRIQQRFGFPAQELDGAVRFEQPEGHKWVPKLIEAFPGDVDAIRVGRPTLEDVFVHLTGHTFWEDVAPQDLLKSTSGRHQAASPGRPHR